MPVIADLKRRRIEGNPAPLRAQILAGFLREKGLTRGLGAELGVLRGETFFYLLEEFPGLHLIGVDTWAPRPGAEAQDGGRSYLDHRLTEYHASVSKRAGRYGRRAIVHVGLTHEAPEQLDLQRRLLDFVFIDADHTERGVTKDIVAWWDHVKVAGWLLGHDITWPSVRRAVDMACPGWFRVSEKESIWACQVT